MNIDFSEEQFSMIRPHLRAWFQEWVRCAEADPKLPLDGTPLPAGSGFGDAIAVSESIPFLFPQRCHEERSTPVDVEFVL